MNATVIIHIIDINDNAPKFTKKIYQVAISENIAVGSSVISVSASDDDIGENAKVTFTLKDENEHFFMETDTGILKVAKVSLI